MKAFIFQSRVCLILKEFSIYINNHYYGDTLGYKRYHKILLIGNNRFLLRSTDKDAKNEYDIQCFKGSILKYYNEIIEDYKIK